MTALAEPVDVFPKSRYVTLTSMGRAAIGSSDFLAIAARAESMDAHVGAIWNAYRHVWRAGASKGDVRVKLHAVGPLAAVLAGVLDDLEEALA